MCLRTARVAPLTANALSRTYSWLELSIYPRVQSSDRAALNVGLLDLFAGGALDLGGCGLQNGL